EDLDRELGLDQAQELVALAEQPEHEVVTGDEDLDGRVVILIVRGGTDGVRTCQGAREGSRAPGPTVPMEAPGRRRPRGPAGRAARAARRVLRGCVPCTRRAPADRNAES